MFINEAKEFEEQVLTVPCHPGLQKGGDAPAQVKGGTA